MTDLTLYHSPASRSAIVRWMLEEVGEPYDIHLLKPGANREPAYLAVNPFGKVPALRHGDMVMTEAAAICCYLADTFPGANLALPIGDRRRGTYLKWLFFGPSCFEPALIDHMLKRGDTPRGQVGWGDIATVLDIVAAAVDPGPYLMGEHFTAADVVIGSGLRWGTMVKAVPERREFAAYAARLGQRPAFARALAKDAELMAA